MAAAAAAAAQFVPALIVERTDGSEAAAPAAKEKVAPAAVGSHQAAGYQAAAVVPRVPKVAGTANYELWNLQLKVVKELLYKVLKTLTALTQLKKHSHKNKPYKYWPITAYSNPHFDGNSMEFF